MLSLSYLDPRRIVAVTLGLSLAAIGHAAERSLTRTDLTCTVNHDGVLVAVPDTGLVTFGGPQKWIGPDTAEWSGVAFDGDGGARRFLVGVGRAPDWVTPRRERLEAVSIDVDDAVIVVKNRADDLLVTSRFWLDPDGPHLQLEVTLENTGEETVRDIWYTREWTGHASWTRRVVEHLLGDGQRWLQSQLVQDSGDRFRARLPRLAPFVPRRGRVPSPFEPNIQRHVWTIGDLPPGGRRSVHLEYTPPVDRDAPMAATLDVPLSLWTSPTWPIGLPIGSANGISFGDYDQDGRVDLFSASSGNLFRNTGDGWQFAGDLDQFMPPATRRYGSSFGDYDNDGLPDIAIEPRNTGGDTCHHLLRNLGGGQFVDVTTDPTVMNQACQADAETICFGDVDGDGNLDMFLPVYPTPYGGPGNFFWHNLGPTGVGGAYRFAEMSAVAGLDNPPGTNRPEGAQLLDTDFDGDVDLYCNGTLYQNQSVPGTPSFTPMSVAGSGIQFPDILEEGIVFHDVDMDGDFDFTAAWTSVNIGVRIHQAWGDGSYELLDASVIDSHQVGLNLGISTEDWDNDGDMDLTTRQVFRRNMLVETGTLKFGLATHLIPLDHLTSATPAWADFDRDGDLDCAIGNWLGNGHFYENTTYGADTPAGDRRCVRVRVVRDSDTVDRGLETEYGALVEVHVLGELDRTRRRKFVSSSGGYLTQNEYALHFGLPPDPAPGNPAIDLVFAVSVDLPGAPEAGLTRIDRHVNPVLGNIRLAQLDDREIVVYRSGKVILGGCELTATPPRPVTMLTSTDGLSRASPNNAPPAPTSSPGPDQYVGIELDTLSATAPIRVKEILVDGQLDDAVSCPGGDANVTVWDVTQPSAPTVVGHGLLDRHTLVTNRRSYLTTNVRLEPGRVFRLVARTTSFRGTPITAPVASGSVRVTGGLRYVDATPCSGAAAAAAVVDPSTVYLAVRFVEDAGGPFCSFGFGTAGALGVPKLDGNGPATAGSTVGVTVTGGPPNANAAFVIGVSIDCVTTGAGSTLVPSPVLVLPATLDGTGAIGYSSPWPTLATPGVTFYLQALIQDGTAPAGVAFSNALAITTQP